MVTTLRELDRILPKNGDQDSKCSKPLKTKKNDDDPLKVKLVPFWVRKFPKPKYAIYSKYRNPNFVIRNEANRWFARGNLKRSDEVKIAERVIGDAIKEAIPRSDDRSPGLCPKHKSELDGNDMIIKRCQDFQKFQEGNYNRADPDDLRREGVCYGLELDVNRANEKSEAAEKDFQSRRVVRRLLKQMLEGTLDRDHINRCAECQRVSLNGHCPVGQAGPSKRKSVKHPASEIYNREPSLLDQKSVVGDFFVSSPESCEFRFDYDKIFSEYNDSPDQVKKCINAALNIDQYYSEDAAVTACLEAMWKSELGTWEPGNLGTWENKDYLNDNFVIIQGKQDYNSPKKCYKLLKKGLEIMKKSPKFVLASFPDAHKVPILKEWVLNRYGFRHTIAEEEKKKLIQNYHINEVMMSGAAPIRGKLHKCPQLRNFGVKKSQKTIDKFVKMDPRVTIQHEVSAGFPCMEFGFLVSDSDCRLMTPRLYRFRPYSRR
jgi:hypothetical protein